MINCKKIGLVILTAFLFVSKVSAQTLKDAEAEFERMNSAVKSDAYLLDKKDTL